MIGKPLSPRTILPPSLSFLPIALRCLHMDAQRARPRARLLGKARRSSGKKRTARGPSACHTFALFAFFCLLRRRLVAGLARWLLVLCGGLGLARGCRLRRGRCGSLQGRLVRVEETRDRPLRELLAQTRVLAALLELEQRPDELLARTELLFDLGERRVKAQQLRVRHVREALVL